MSFLLYVRRERIRTANSGETAQLKANCCVMGMRCPANSHKPSFHVNTAVTSKHNNVKGTGTGHRGGGMPTTNMDESMTEEELSGISPLGILPVWVSIRQMTLLPTRMYLGYLKLLWVWGNCAEDLLPLNTFDGILNRRKGSCWSDVLECLVLQSHCLILFTA
ncbi:hypothetical protein ACLOJK_011107 [Asimina triloba]